MESEIKERRHFTERMQRLGAGDNIFRFYMIKILVIIFEEKKRKKITNRIFIFQKSQFGSGSGSRGHKISQPGFDILKITIRIQRPNNHNLDLDPDPEATKSNNPVLIFLKSQSGSRDPKNPHSKSVTLDFLAT